MNNLYIVVNLEGRYLVNITPENAAEMVELGWKVYHLGVSDPNLVPGRIGNICEYSDLFEQNCLQVLMPGSGECVKSQ